MLALVSRPYVRTYNCVLIASHGPRETLWSTMRWVHNLRCQGCAEEKHRSVSRRADVRQRSVLHWGGWAEEIPEPEPAIERDEETRGGKRYRLRWLRLCDTCTRMRTEMVAEWKALQLRLRLEEDARLRAQATHDAPATASGHTLIVAGPLAGRHAAARALAEQGDLGDQVNQSAGHSKCHYRLQLLSHVVMTTSFVISIFSEVAMCV